MVQNLIPPKSSRDTGYQNVVVKKAVISGDIFAFRIKTNYFEFSKSVVKNSRLIQYCEHTEDNLFTEVIADVYCIKYRPVFLKAN